MPPKYVTGKAPAIRIAKEGGGRVWLCILERRTPTSLLLAVLSGEVGPVRKALVWGPVELEALPESGVIVDPLGRWEIQAEGPGAGADVD